MRLSVAPVFDEVIVSLSIKNSPTVDELVTQMRQEFDSANKELAEKVSKY